MNRELRHDPDGRSYGLGDLAAIFFRHKKKAVAFSLSVVALAALVIYFAPRTYRSEARLFLQVGRESIRLDPTATTGQTIALQQSGRDNEVATSLEVLRSRSIVEQAVDRLTPEVVLGDVGEGAAKPNPVAETVMAPVHYLIGVVRGIDPISIREEAVIEILENFEVDAEHDSTVLSLNYDAKTPRLAQQVLHTIVDVYRHEHARLHQTTGSKPFFTQQRDELEQQLVAAETKLRDAKNRMGFASIDSRRGTLETRLGSLEMTRVATVQSIASAEAHIASLEDHSDAMPERMHTSTILAPNTGADALRAQLYALQVELMSLEAKYSGDHPLVASKRVQVDEARDMVQKEEGMPETTTDTVNDNRRALQLERAQAESSLAGYQAQLKELDGQRVAALADMRELNHDETELQELERVASLARTNFFRYANDLEQARVDEELNRHDIINIAVAQDATYVEKPVSPSKLLVAAMSLALLTAGTTVLVLGSEKLGSRVTAEDQIEEVLRLPVLATVPEGRAYAAAR